MRKIVVVIVLAIAVVGMAYVIETQARPDTGRRGVQVQGESGTGH
jgi:hypothetical protein